MNMNSSPNYYEILGIPKTATDQEIKKAYRALSLKHHPDRGGDTSLYQQINEAYEVLSDPSQRQQYDNPPPPPQMQFNGMQMHEEMNNIFDVFRNMTKQRFDTAGGGAHMPNIFFHQGSDIPHIFMQQTFHSKPIPTVYNVTISFEQSYHGFTLPIEHERWIIKDNAKVVEKNIIYVDIPQGVGQNEEIILPQKGNQVNENSIGDVKVIVQITMNVPFLDNTQIFDRHGLDLIIRKPITLKESLCGFSFELCHPIGKKLMINNLQHPQITQPNSSHTIPNYGMVRGNTKGNLIIQFDVEFPKTITPEQLAIFQAHL